MGGMNAIRLSALRPGLVKDLVVVDYAPQVIFALSDSFFTQKATK